MHTTTDGHSRPIDVAAIQATITTALATSNGPLVMDDLAALERSLRGHIERLLPDAEVAAERLWRGSIAWYQQRGRLETIRHQAAQGLTDRPLTAHIHVTTLARECEWLLTQLGAHR
ncbi:DUF6415 family natural product biosynthesis protein [Streptomyces sp. NPDC001922]|uniref:DUF6415 family natural product biosynthesis protein n=1 Tax=Streptomyces sp. NPDC001922 TaxID=3364624 RepID=UPI0036BC8AA8